MNQDLVSDTWILQLGAVRRVHLTFTSMFSKKTCWSACRRLWYSTIETGQIPACVAGVSKSMGP
jgi:hypothetical protein